MSGSNVQGICCDYLQFSSQSFCLNYSMQYSLCLSLKRSLVYQSIRHYLGVFLLLLFPLSCISVCSFKIFVYDGKTGEKVCALGGGKAHDGGIYAVSIT